MKQKQNSKSVRYKELWKRVKSDPFYSDFMAAVMPDEEMRRLTPYIKWKPVNNPKLIGKPCDP